MTLVLKPLKDLEINLMLDCKGVIHRPASRRMQFEGQGKQNICPIILHFK